MGDDPVSAVLVGVANAKGVDPSDVEVALEEYVSTDALRALARHSDGVWQLTFELPAHTVTVDSDGRITVDGDLVHRWSGMSDSQ